jgi:hypothetical protein
LSDFATGVPTYHANDEALVPVIEVRCGRRIDFGAGEEGKALVDWLKVFIIQVGLRIAATNDVESLAKRFFKGETAMARALDLSHAPAAVRNLFGPEPKFDSSEWVQVKSKEVFELRREVPAFSKHERDASLLSKASPPEGLPASQDQDPRPSKASPQHRRRTVLGLINPTLWDRAKWNSTAFLTAPGQAPILLLGFLDSTAGRAIFDELRRTIGQGDRNDRLRISIITGVDRDRPASYRVMICENLAASATPSSDEIVVISRFHQMDPSNTDNLDRFRSHLEKTPQYFFAPAQVDLKTKQIIPYVELSISKSTIRIVPAWTLDETHLEMMTIKKDDRVFVPSGVTTVPLHAALARNNERSVLG